jgi:mono/diheme cytochrome c family protein
MNFSPQRVSLVLAVSLALVVIFALAAGVASPAASAQSAKPPDVSGIAATNPTPYASASIAKGKATYLRLCPECHDDDGKALAQTLAPAADLTDPSRWKFGTSDAHLFRSIRDGAGAAMPVFGNQLSANDIWDIVNFIRSIGPSSLQPKPK